LGRSTLPREDLIAVFTRACGLGETDVQRWLAARRTLAMGSAVDPSAVQSADVRPAERPDRPIRRVWRRGHAIAAGMAAMVIAVTVGVLAARIARA
jgi:hypothetical protein